MGNRTRTRTVGLEYIAKIDKLEAELSKLPGISKKEARGMVRGLNKELKRATKAAKSAARQQRAAFKKLGDTFEGTKRIADAMGGSAAGAAGSIEHLGRSVLALASALGPAGAVAASAGIAIGGIATAGAAAALAAGDLADELEAAGRAPVITAEQRDQVDVMDAAIQELKFSVKELVLAFGADFAPAVTTVAVALADASDASRGLVDTWRDLRDASAPVARVFTAIGSVGLTEALASMAGATSDYADQQARAAREAQRFQKDLERMDGAIRRVEVAEVKATETSRERGRVSTAASRAAAEAERAKTKAIAQAERDAAKAASEAARLRQSIHMEMLARIEEREAAKEAAEKERVARAMQRAQELAAFEQAQRQAVIDNAFAALDSLSQLAEDVYGRQAAAAQAAGAEEIAQVDALRDRRRELFAELEEATTASERARIKSEIAVTTASIKAGFNRANAENKAMLKAFRAQKALAVVRTLVNGAQALIAGYAQTGPPPLPGGIAVSAAVAASTAASLATIALQSAPSIAHDGAFISPGPDEQNIRARRGESVLNQRATEAMGGREGVEAANRGKPSGQGAYIVTLDGRTVAAGVADRVRGIVLDELSDLGSAVGFTPIYG